MTDLTSSSPLRLTQFSHGAGCGCKIAPKVLDEILKTSVAFPDNDKLLVGNHSRDDAAVYDLGNGTAIISTTDFFMPIVDDPFDFGRIAAANSISDVYAMGGKPLMAIAVLGWPVNKLPADVAQKVVEGGRSICLEAGIPLAGGHSIDSPEPIFGLAVTGILPLENLKQNNTAREGDLLLLTKPLGVGTLSTAQKRGLLQPDQLDLIVKQMSTLNKAGEALGKIKGVHAMTDVTGFGFLGHLIEMADGSGLSAEVWYQKIPAIPAVKEFITQGVFPDGTTRNWSSYGDKVKFEKGTPVAEAFKLLPDPQTNGGLLIAVSEDALTDVQAVLKSFGITTADEPLGRLTAKAEKVVTILP